MPRDDWGHEDFRHVVIVPRPDRCFDGGKIRRDDLAEQKLLGRFLEHAFPSIHGRIANTRAGNPRPFFTLGQVATRIAPVGGTLSRLSITSIW